MRPYAVALFRLVRSSSKNAGWVVLLLFGLVTVLGAQDGVPKENGGPPILKIGSLAPDFNLPGVDGQQHRLSDYASSKFLVIVFTCDHCPVAQMYEKRIKQLAT